ncbi:hypothetical protein MarSH_020 [Marseillevirus Shanghai 1]|nr:hypothetical protein MarSH_020 [Marseillevirus Shanghai 1]
MQITFKSAILPSKMDKLLCKGIAAFGAQRIYERFSNGRSSYDKKEFEEWAMSPFPRGLGIQKGIPPDVLSYLATELCFTYEKRGFIFADGKYHEMERTEEPEKSGEEVYETTRNIFEFVEDSLGRKIF